MKWIIEENISAASDRFNFAMIFTSDRPKPKFEPKPKEQKFRFA
jgi:hypothetical protein